MFLKTLLPAVALCLIPLAGMAEDTKATLIDQLYRQSGMERQMEQLPMIIQVAFDQAAADHTHFRKLPRSVVAEMRGAVTAAYDPEIIKRAIMDECHETLSIEDLNQVLGWLRSPLGRRITRLEESAASPESFLALQRYAVEVQQTPPPPERLAVVQQLDAAVKVTETGVEIAMNTQLAVAMAVLASLPVEQQPTPANLAAALEQQRAQIQNLVRNQTLISLLYTYRGITDDEILEYIAFASSSAGVRYHDASIAGFKSALLEGGYKWGESIGEILNHSESKTDV